MNGKLLSRLLESPRWKFHYTEKRDSYGTSTLLIDITVTIEYIFI